MTPNFLADEDTGHGLISACRKKSINFPMVHIAEWQNGSCLGYKDPQLLAAARLNNLILVSFDRSSLAHEAGKLTKTGEGHAGVIIFRRSVPRLGFGHQARLLMELWCEASQWNWADLIVYLPRA